MKAVMAEVPQHLLDERKRCGGDRWDEMWEGVLHMPPMPNIEHQQLEFLIQLWLYRHWVPQHGAQVIQQVNLSPRDQDWTHDFRIPDLVLLLPHTFHMNRNEYFHGPPTVVVEIRSPHDESLKKMSWYANLGVPEVWLVERDTRVPQVHALTPKGYRRLKPDADGWVRSPVTAVELRHAKPNRLALRMDGDASTMEEVP